MAIPILPFPADKLINIGVQHSENIRYQSTPEELEQDILRLQQGVLSESGALVINTGTFTGRSPKDRFIVRDAITANAVDWNDINQPLEEQYFHLIYKKLTHYLSKQPQIWVRDSYACADDRYRLNIRLVTDKPYISLFAYNMFLRPEEKDLHDFQPQWHVVAAPDLELNPAECGVRQSNAVVVSFQHKTILIAGTGYTGEAKKGIFSILNFLLPQKNVLPMHCSANKGDEGDTAIFFGLSGTGKTTLSADPSRHLIGDDEHGWAEDSVFNFEGGCYAKTLYLSEEREPQIFHAIRPGALLENVSFFPNSNQIDFDDASCTENGRVSYPLHFIPNAAEPAVGNTPRNIFFLTCDAYGVLPPIARLTPGQAMYQFLSGYTAKVAGTETGITEPKPTFSACFGAPFLPLHPNTYAQMLGQKIKDHEVNVWLVNTGWTGGPYGVGRRMELAHTRALLTAALTGVLETVPVETDPVFGLAVPTYCPGVPPGLLQPRNTWADKNAYDEQAQHLVRLFVQNFEQYAAVVSPEILQAAPRLK